MSAVVPSSVMDLQNYLNDCQASMDSWLRAEAEGPAADPEVHYEQLHASIRGLRKRLVMEHNARMDPTGGAF